MFLFFGLGKPRSDFGKFLDKEGITQTELEKASKVGRSTISRLCSDEEYFPKISTAKKIAKGFDRLGVDFDEDEFFG